MLISNIKVSKFVCKAVERRKEFVYEGLGVVVCCWYGSVY